MTRKFLSTDQGSSNVGGTLVFNSPSARWTCSLITTFYKIYEKPDQRHNEIYLLKRTYLAKKCCFFQLHLFWSGHETAISFTYKNTLRLINQAQALFEPIGTT